MTASPARLPQERPVAPERTNTPTSALCGSCGHDFKYHGTTSRLCHYPTHFDGPACRCTEPRPEETL